MEKTTGSAGNKEQIRKRLKFIAYMLKALKGRRSWCSLLHIQKSCYIAQEMLDIDLGYDFVPYKYGPYSFDLQDDVSLALNRFILRAQQRPGYGHSYGLYDDVKEYIEKNKYDYANQVKFIAEWFKDRPARELEKITSAHMVRYKIKKGAPEEEQEQELKDWKDKLSIDDIKGAFKEVEIKVKEAQDKKHL